MPEVAVPPPQGVGLREGAEEGRPGGGRGVEGADGDEGAESVRAVDDERGAGVRVEGEGGAEPEVAEREGAGEDLGEEVGVGGRPVGGGEGGRVEGFAGADVEPEDGEECEEGEAAEEELAFGCGWGVGAVRFCAHAGGEEGVGAPVEFLEGVRQGYWGCEVEEDEVAVCVEGEAEHVVCPACFFVRLARVSPDRFHA